MGLMRNKNVRIKIKEMMRSNLHTEERYDPKP